MFPLNVSTIGLPKMMKSHKGYIYLTCLPCMLPTSDLKAHKVVLASLGSRFSQQDLYLPPMIEILLIYFFPNGSFGGGVGREKKSEIEIASFHHEKGRAIHFHIIFPFQPF